MAKEACEKCGSSDAKEVYEDGHSHCFSCGDHISAEGESVKSELYVEDKVFKRLKTRNIDQATCEKYGYFTKDGKQWAPYYNQGGKLIGYKQRTKDKEFYWKGSSKGTMLFGQQLWKKGSGKKVTVTEGELDALAISQAFDLKWPVVSVPNGAQGAIKAIKENFEWLNSFEEIVFAFDNDKAGQEAVKECAEIFPFGKVKVVSYPDGCKDACDLLKFNHALVQRLVWDAYQYSPDDILCGEDLRAEIHKEPVVGLPFNCFPELSEKLKGLRKHEFYLFSAGSGLGKTTAAHEIGYDLLMNSNQKIGIVALEDTKRDTAERYLSMHLDKPLRHDREGVTSEDLDRAYDETIALGNWFLYDHFGSLDCDRLISKLEYFASALQVDWIILDHISIVVSGNDTADERKDIDKLMTGMNSLIKKFPVGIIAIVHLKRPAQGKSYNEGRQVSLSDLRGSAGLEQMSTAVIGFEGDQQDEEIKNLRQVRILKNRDVGWVGKVPGCLEYIPETGRLIQSEEPCPFDDETSDDNNEF